MKILIVSGFLGAGKTTFIKELIRRSGTQPVIMENEYGDNSIDAAELKGASSESNKLEILEFMEGCVCCTMKDSFVNSVLTVFSSLSPEYLIVEPTGVGRLSNIIKNLEPILHGNITLLKPIVVLPPRSYSQNMEEWPDLYRDQVAHAEKVVFSKCEHEIPELLSKVEEEIRSINPNAEIVKEHYSKKEDEWWRSLLEVPIGDTSTEDAELNAPNIFQITLNHARLEHPAELILLLEDCLRGELGNIVRSKGTVPVGKEMLRFDLADRLYAITDSSEASNQCVFIGKNLDREKICERMGTSLMEESPVATPESLAASLGNAEAGGARGGNFKKISYKAAKTSAEMK